MTRTASVRTIRGVMRDEAITRLPSSYAVALRMRDAGAGHDLVARALAIDEPAVAPLLALAEAKLATLLGGAKRHIGGGDDEFARKFGGG